MNESPDNDISSAPLTRIVCAAIRHQQTGLVICGARHYDSIMQAVIIAICEFTDVARARGYYGCEQGFVTNISGEFVTREQAWNIAEAAEQIIPHPSTIIGQLHSEDLY